MGRPAGSVLEVRINGEVFAQKCMTVLHYRVIGASSLDPGGPEETDFLDTISIGAPFDIMSAYTSCQGATYLNTRMDAQYVASTRYVNVSKVIAEPGLRVGAVTAQNVSAVVTKRTVFAGRDQVGSYHLPGIRASDYASGKLVAGLITDLGTLNGVLAQNVISTVGGGEYQPVLYHRGEIAPNNVDVITQWVVQDSIRTMRRRTLGVGM